MKVMSVDGTLEKMKEKKDVNDMNFERQKIILDIEALQGEAVELRAIHINILVKERLKKAGKIPKLKNFALKLLGATFAEVVSCVSQFCNFPFYKV